MYCPRVLGWGLGSSTKARLCPDGKAPSRFCVFTDSEGPSLSPINLVAHSLYLPHSAFHRASSFCLGGKNGGANLKNKMQAPRGWVGVRSLSKCVSSEWFDGI